MTGNIRAKAPTWALPAPQLMLFWSAVAEQSGDTALAGIDTYSVKGGAPLRSAIALQMGVDMYTQLLVFLWRLWGDKLLCWRLRRRERDAAIPGFSNA